jgi:N-acylneuraminate cytidylyltransferase
MTICIIPAKGQSKRIERKNLKEFCGKPLILWTIEQAKESKVDKVFVSTEDYEIKALSLKAGVSVIDRPVELAGDKVTIESVLNDHFKIFGLQAETVVLLQPTSPLRKPDDINNMIDMLKKEGTDSCISCVVEDDIFLWENNKRTISPVTFRKFDRGLRNEFLRENGSVYVFKGKAFEQTMSRYGAKTSFYKMERWQGKELDVPEDWEEAEWLMKKHILKGKEKNAAK